MKLPGLIGIMVLVSFVTPSTCVSTDNYFAIVSSLQARPLGMGGAYTSIAGGCEATIWNPAGLYPGACHRLRPVEIHLDPALGTAVANSRMDDLSRAEKGVLIASSAVRSVSFSKRSFAVAAVFAESPVRAVGSKRVFPSDPFPVGYYTTVAARAGFADAVSLGAAASFYRVRRNDDCDRGEGLSFGMLLNPDPRVAAGILYFIVPSCAGDFRTGFEGFSHKSVNGGISWMPFDDLIVSFDLRDMVEVNDETALRPHFGLEGKPLEFTAMRCGYYRDVNKDDVVSFGLGLSLYEKCQGIAYYRTLAGVVIDYGVVLTRNSTTHVLTAGLRF